MIDALILINLMMNIVHLHYTNLEHYYLHNLIAID